MYSIVAGIVFMRGLAWILMTFAATLNFLIRVINIIIPLNLIIYDARKSTTASRVVVITARALRIGSVSFIELGLSYTRHEIPRNNSTHVIGLQDFQDFFVITSLYRLIVSNRRCYIVINCHFELQGLVWLVLLNFSVFSIISLKLVYLL